MRFDRVQMNIDGRMPGDNDESGERRFNQWSGSAGLSYRYFPSHQAISTAFETPTFTEFANPAGSAGFNPAVDPQKATNYELGLRGALDSGIDYDLTLFWVNVRDELIPYSLTEFGERDFYRYAGNTTRQGMERQQAGALTTIACPAYRNRPGPTS